MPGGDESVHCRMRAASVESMKRWSVGAEFLVDADDESEARRLVGNFVDSFPDQVEGGESVDPDVILQEASEV